MEWWQALLVGALTLAGTVYASYRASKATVRAKELDVDGQAFERAEGIYTGAIETLQKQYTDLNAARQADKIEHAKDLAIRDAKIERIERDVQEVRDRNNALVTFVYKMLAILRAHELTAKIDPADVPDGIHI